jgi:hypothetical protein
MSIYNDISKFSGDYSCTMFNAAAGGTTANSTTATIADGVKIGSIEIVTNSAYNGTTGTAVLQGSNDNTTFATVKQDDNTTDMSFTLAVSSTYTWYLKAVLFKFYRIVYTKGDATLGTITANLVGKK